MDFDHSDQNSFYSAYDIESVGNEEYELIYLYFGNQHVLWDHITRDIWAEMTENVKIT